MAADYTVEAIWGLLGALVVLFICCVWLSAACRPRTMPTVAAAPSDDGVVMV